MDEVTLKSLSEQIRALHEQVDALARRLAEIEAPAAQQPSPGPPPEAAAEEGISEEVLTILAAAAAAYLGKRAPIRQVRLLASQAWAQQGRAFIQASHHIDRRQD